jgi:hypothetical protein
LEPRPETSDALRELGKYGDTAVADSLNDVASNERAARRDCVEYLDGGPCVAAGHSGDV